MQVRTSEAKEMLIDCIKVGLVPFLQGSPGIGKSDIVRTIASEFNLKVVDLRLSQCDPTDLSGFPMLLGDKAGYVPMNTFLLENDSLPKGYNGVLLFLDEFNSAPRAVQCAA